ncbi:MAG: type II toxin-antitoxin system VapC family toxin [Candidatus Verstraetearchaeota archaeon]|nr:type II toxin-antitoxin system VapC family toxin [Candidatus Verstraetearchaeota archaeon]
MMIESDVLYAYVKENDWLKEASERLVSKIEKGDFGEVYASREVLHELYYVSLDEEVRIDDYVYRVANLTSVKNLVFLETSYEIDLLAISLMKQYRLTSIFDAYYAATCLNQVRDRKIVTTDTVYDRIPGISRIDPRDLKLK